MTWLMKSNDRIRIYSQIQDNINKVLKILFTNCVTILNKL